MICTTYFLTFFSELIPPTGNGIYYNYGWAGGVDLGLFPLPRTVMFGVNITL